MQNTSYIALSRQSTLWRQLDTIANNLANANTPAYKSQEMLFREYLVQTRSTDRALGGKLSFVQDNAAVRDTREGAISQTGNPLDFAIHGDGYFQIETEAGMRYGRNGHFRLDQTGMLVNSDGYAVMDDRDQPIIFAPNETRIEVASDGTVSTENGRVAKLKVVKFANDQEMRQVGTSLYETTQTAETVARPEIQQGMMENSNVEPVLELTRMTQVMRQYEGIQKLIDNESDRQTKAIDVLSNGKSSS
ncbi:flagellar basal-body rod protein FlgF [Phaeospirillum tilakii]|uniref:Flagellar basal-body rod protein FlgF n=1 Tax=Phaeospirillum tilakii TaxID=741673 RepID=A0ABW5CDJ2_9PROT